MTKSALPVQNWFAALLTGCFRSTPVDSLGLGIGDEFNELYRQFDRIGGTHLAVFDEINHTEDANTLLYELPRARANGHISEAKVGVIEISNDYTF